MAKYGKKIVDKIVGLIKSDTYTIAEICRQVGITPKTFHQWKEEHPEFCQELGRLVDKCHERLSTAGYPDQGDWSGAGPLDHAAP